MTRRTFFDRNAILIVPGVLTLVLLVAFFLSHLTVAHGDGCIMVWYAHGGDIDTFMCCNWSCTHDKI